MYNTESTWKETAAICEQKNQYIIGITGKMGCGKDTVAEFIKCAFAHTEIIPFAKPLKDMMIEYFGMTHDDVYTQKGKESFNPFWGMTNREALQKVGTECFRNNFHPDTWLKLMELNIRKSNAKVIVVPDVRFEKEFELLRNLGGATIKIIRPDSERTEAYTQHASEQGCSSDVDIFNDGTLTELYACVLRALNGATAPCKRTMYFLKDNHITLDMEHATPEMANGLIAFTDNFNHRFK